MLSIWMPCNTDIRNQGLTYSQPTGSYTIVNDGPYGKCVHTTSAASINSQVKSVDGWDVQASCGFGAWLKFNLTEMRYASAYTYNSTNTVIHNCILGYGSYGGFSLDLESNNINTDGAFNSVIVRADIRFGGSIKNSSSKTVTFNEWHHYYTQWDNTRKALEFYYDGSLFWSGTNASQVVSGIQQTFVINGAMVWGGNAPGKCLPYYVSDVRAYQGLLTEEDVKNLYKCKLFDLQSYDNFPSVNNLSVYPQMVANVSQNYGWDKTLHANAISVNGFDVGYNSGVPSASTGYHACWEMIDGIPTMVQRDINSQFGASLKHRWLGITGCRGLTGIVGPNTKYTISMDARSDVNGKQISSGLYYRPHASVAYGFKDGCAAKSLTTEWKRYYWHYTTSAAVETVSAVYVYGHNGTLEGTAYIRNVQFELGHVENEFSCGNRPALAYNGHGTNGIFESVSVVESGATLYFDGTNSYIKGTLDFMSKIVDTGYTFSLWINSQEADSSRSIYFGCGDQGNGWTFAIEKQASTNKFRVYNNGAPDWYVDNCVITPNQWIHVVVTRSGGTVTVYKNGASVGTKTGFTNHTSFDRVYYIGSDYRTGDTRFKGYIGDFKIYANPLTAAEVLNLYNKEKVKYQ